MTARLRAELEAHRTVNSLLARALNYPDAALVRSLTSGEFATALAAALRALGRPEAAALVAPLRSLYEASQQPDDSVPQQFLLELERDYTRIFFASSPRLAYLFESVYREGGLLQQSTFDVARLYHDAGIAPSQEFTLPPDHIALELEFLAFLFFQEAQALATQQADSASYAQSLRRTLLDRHLLQFAHILAARLAEHARCELYRATAAALRCYFS